DDETSIAHWDRVSVHTPEPVDNPPAFAAGVEFLKTISPQTRLFLYGEGPDNALQYEWRPYVSHLLARRRALPRSLHAPARTVMGIDSADDRRQSTPETVAGTVPRLAERRIR